MNSVSCKDYYLRLNTELNHYEAFNAVLSDILSKDSISRISLELLQDFVKIYMNSIRNEMNDLASEDNELGLMVSPKTTKGE